MRIGRIQVFASLFLLIAIVVGVLAHPALANASHRPSTATDLSAAAPNLGGILFTSGPYVNGPGAGPGGTDLSILQNTSLAMTIFGFGNNGASSIWLADDFTIPVGETWNLNAIRLYNYQTGSTTTSTMTGVTIQIWDGPPNDAGSTIIFGDLTTNRLASSTWTNSYRVAQNAQTGTTRPIMENIATVNTSLGAGTYWVQWGTTGTLASGPWGVPITITGQTTTGNALQFNGSWAAALDGTFPQGLAFAVEGVTVGNTPTPTNTPTNTAVPPTNTATATNTPVPSTSTATATNTATNTPVPPTPTITITPTSEGRVPDISLNPTAFAETHNSAPQVTTDTLNITNEEVLTTLNWTITEDNSRPFSNPNPAQPRDLTAPAARQGVAGGTVTSPIVLGPIVGDGSFETGTPNAAWEEFSSTFGTPLCDAVCGLGNGTGPRTGAWWSWFGGIASAETGILTQTVTIPSGSAELSFWLEIPAAGTNGFLSVRMDGNELFRVEEDTPGYNPYAEVTVDISAYAGGTHVLTFFSTTDTGASATNFFVDDVAITSQAGGVCTAPTDIPWLTVSPMNGSTGGPNTTPVTLTYNSTGVTAGTYNATLCIASNDPDEPLVTVPITFTVDVPTAIDLTTFSNHTALPVVEWATAGLLLLAGAVVLLRRR